MLWVFFISNHHRGCYLTFRIINFQPNQILTVHFWFWVAPKFSLENYSIIYSFTFLKMLTRTNPVFYYNIWSLNRRWAQLFCVWFNCAFFIITLCCYSFRISTSFIIIRSFNIIIALSRRGKFFNCNTFPFVFRGLG